MSSYTESKNRAREKIETEIIAECCGIGVRENIIDFCLNLKIHYNDTNASVTNMQCTAHSNKTNITNYKEM